MLFRSGGQKMKKLLSMGLIASLSLAGLVACGNDGGNESSTPTPNSSEQGSQTSDSNGSTSGDKVEIKLWLDNDDYGVAMEEALEAALPNIDIVFEKVGSVDALSKLELDGPAGLGADVFIIPHDNMSSAINGQMLLPLGPEIGADIEERFLEGSVGTVKVDNTYYGMQIGRAHV